MVSNRNTVTIKEVKDEGNWYFAHRVRCNRHHYGNDEFYEVEVAG